MQVEEMRDVFNNITLSDLQQVAKRIVSTHGDVKVWLLNGEMGAGKTTFIKALCKELGSDDATSSPTFSIVNEYQIANGKIFHFDFYRIKNEMEAYDIGVDEYFYSGNYCFIEWSEKIPNLIPEQHIEIKIDINTSTLRTIEVSVHDGKEKNRI